MRRSNQCVVKLRTHRVREWIALYFLSRSPEESKTRIDCSGSMWLAIGTLCFSGPWAVMSVHTELSWAKSFNGVGPVVAVVVVVVPIKASYMSNFVEPTPCVVDNNSAAVLLCSPGIIRLSRRKSPRAAVTKPKSHEVITGHLPLFSASYFDSTGGDVGGAFRFFNPHITPPQTLRLPPSGFNSFLLNYSLRRENSRTNQAFRTSAPRKNQRQQPRCFF